MKGPEDPYIFEEMQKPTPARGKGRGKGRGKKAQTANEEFLVKVGDKINARKVCMELPAPIN